MARKSIARLMTGIFIAQVAVNDVKAATNAPLADMPISRWPKAFSEALQTTIHNDAFYMPAAVALMQHYQS
jgi:hypothetical protein